MFPLQDLKTHNSVPRGVIFTHTPSAARSLGAHFAITRPKKKKHLGTTSIYTSVPLFLLSVLTSGKRKPGVTSWDTEAFKNQQ